MSDRLPITEQLRLAGPIILDGPTYRYVTGQIDEVEYRRLIALPADALYVEAIPEPVLRPGFLRRLVAAVAAWWRG